MTDILTPIKTRTTEEVFEAHREAIETLDLEKLMADYAEDALMVTVDGALKGRDAILNGFFKKIMANFPDAKVTYEKIVIEENICLIQWSADASAMRMPIGLGVLVIEDGFIQQQVEWFQMELKQP